MDDRSIYNQAYLFSNAKFIVGPHGSAFVNMIWCNPSTTILELFGPGYFSAHDYILARQCSLDWFYLLGDSDEPSTFTSDFSINLDSLKNLVHSIVNQ